MFLPIGTPRSLILEYIELSPDMMTSFERPSCYVGTEYRAAEDGDVGSPDSIHLASRQSSMPFRLCTTLTACGSQLHYKCPIKYHEILRRLEPDSRLPRNFVTLESVT